MKAQDTKSSLGLTVPNIPVIENPSVLIERDSPSVSKDGIAHNPGMEKDALKELEIKIKYAEEIHQYVREYIRMADQKAAFFFAASSALLAYHSKHESLTVWIKSLKFWTVVDFFAFVTTFALSISILACLLVIAPRLSGSRKGLIFFKAIKEFDSQQEYISEIKTSGLSDLCDEKLRHVYVLASVCSQKYNTLAVGLWSGGIAFCVTVFMLIFI